jgi:hypothetical protein
LNDLVHIRISKPLLLATAMRGLSNGKYHHTVLDIWERIYRNDYGNKKTFTPAAKQLPSRH